MTISIFDRLYRHRFFSRFKPGKATAAENEEAEAEALRFTFRKRYHSFRLLLGANTRALENMSEIEQALQGIFPFDMAFVRAQCTSVIVNVHRMIQELTHLAPEKYAGLTPRFVEIRNNIERCITDVRQVGDTRLLIAFDQVDAGMVNFVGNKMADLCDIRKQLGCRVPPGFVITTHAFRRFFDESGLQDDINRQFQTADLKNTEDLHALSAAVQQQIQQARLPRDIEEAVTSACARLAEQAGGDVRLALRSSCVGEDSHSSSFAGQYHSELNIDPESVLFAYKTVVASKYTPQAITYRINRGFRDEDTPMAVGCMVMVDAAAGGVTYSRNPVDPADDAVYIHAVRGLPKAVVDGSAPCDLFVVSRKEPMELIRQHIALKTNMYSPNKNEGLDRIPVDAETAARPALGESRPLLLARMAVALENLYGGPRDIEWAIDTDGRIILLQCRPLRLLAAASQTKEMFRESCTPSDIIAAGHVTASPGTAWGETYVPAKAADALCFPKGAILVVNQALPKWAALLDRAVAVVSEHGGMAGHLASVCREFGIPALFGVDNAPALLPTGMRITVDADQLKIYRGAKEYLLGARRRRSNPMAGSPVHQTLKRASRMIVPLNLLDPDSVDFRPEKCVTLHDITRFIHEKSVHEMFIFGKNLNWPERAAKQLVHDNVPMQWWVLDLDDGFAVHPVGKFIRFEDIVSIPMIALWEGFTAIAWDGPPAIDGRGFMSVMFQSTADPALATGIRSRYAQQNYFIISKNYCTLNSRTGYHFSIIEALVGERDRENYASFQFKGGAADNQRRRRRITFIGDILEDNGFAVRMRADHLTARIEGRPQADMIVHLRILGYLNLHTRQLDMIMSNPARIDYYDQKIRKDIGDILSGKVIPSK